jgi:hypothetical protein
MVCAILAQFNGVWLVRAKCGYMLSRDRLVNGVWWGRTKLWHGAAHRVKCMYNICAWYKNYTRQILVHGTKTARGGYWHAT